MLDRHATSGIPAAAHHRMLVLRAPGRSGCAGRLPRPRVRARLGVLSCVAILGLSAPAAATWSLVAVDPVQREVGVAIASCIGGVERTLGVVPGRGVVAAQAWTSFRGRDRAVAMLGEGASPAEALAAIANADCDRWELSLFALRQYGVAALAPRSGRGAGVVADPLEDLETTARDRGVRRVGVIDGDDRVRVGPADERRHLGVQVQAIRGAHGLAAGIDDRPQRAQEGAARGVVAERGVAAPVRRATGPPPWRARG
jgi:hypothetical protein